MSAIRATYRLQLNKDFTFADATALVPYLDTLGVSHAYLSPILMARPGSTHGYDTVDHTRINPELGTLDDFRALAQALRQRDMGIILDFVPNHMGVGGADNGLWLDVLKHGEASRYADWFDIDWHPPHAGMDGKILVPFLGSSYPEALAAGELRLKVDGSEFAVWAYDSEKLPIRPEDARALLNRHGSAEAAIAAHTGTVGHAGTWGALDSLIATQHWRIAHFAVASDEINYRRFFINSDLAGIRIDRPDVFEHAHGLIFALVNEGLIDGLRLDHIDGLLDPQGYLERLRGHLPSPFYVVVEKILAPHEQLRADWPVDGTTGYETGALLTRALMQADAEPALDRAYAEFVGEVTAPEAEAYRCKLRVMDNELTAELDALARHCAAIARSVHATRDLTEAGLKRALRETIAHLAVYRTYVDDDGIGPHDRREMAIAIAKARRARPEIQPAVFDFVAGVLGGTLGAEYEPRLTAALVGRFQQYTGPVMAKGLEDTALYRFNRLVAINEVGAHPDRFSATIAAFHDANLARLQTHPLCMLATSTHDTKRGEDLRAIIGAISDAPALWTEALPHWRSMLARHGDIAPNDLYLFLQLLLGGWPINGEPEGLAHRLKDAMTKSLREARQRSDWGVNNRAYEDKISDFIDAALADADFMASFHPTRAPLAAIGRRKSLIQAGLKLTIPGIPDIYRGAEDWEQSFVDPDNRRPVDFDALARRLAMPTSGPDDKIVLTQTLLELRRQFSDLFAQGSYEPLDLGQDILAYRRQFRSDGIVVLADLSPGHARGIVHREPGDVIDGTPNGPLLVLRT